jgi:2,3-bisphosphoglycerate-independent phosphoglycerate mutase
VSEAFLSLVVPAETKIVMVVMDGLGGIRAAGRGSELAEANTPNLDALALEGSSGVHTVVRPGVTPGSGAGHLALFGYDPLAYALGRGVLSAAGTGFDLLPGDVAARVNFCTLDAAGNVADRRAGRLPTEENQRLCSLLGEKLAIEGADVFIQAERDHRALLVLRGEGLTPDVADTDPQRTGVPPSPPLPARPAAAKTASIVRELLGQVAEILHGEAANFILLRGFDTLHELPSFADRYSLDACAIAGYPTYAGLARILGMASLPLQPTFADEVAALEQSWRQHDFFYIHQKKTDSAAEDGDFEKKMAAIEEVDAQIPRIRALKPDVICITGDHATPSQLKAHSWHPVPVVMWGPRTGADEATRFDEETARHGALGQIKGTDVMPLMLAAADRLTKFGA